MSKFKVILTNSSMGVTVGSATVSGQSGKRYGYSFYSDKYRCHAIEMTLEEYEAAVNDLSNAWHMARRKWVPHFVEVAGENVVTPVNNPLLRDTAIGWARQLSKEDIQQIARDAGLIITAVPIEANPIQENRMDAMVASVGDTVSCDYLPDRYWSLIKIAKEEGANVAGLKKIADLQAAILTHRQQKAA